MKRLILIFLIGSTLFFSCSKNDEDSNLDPSNETVLDYLPLTVGNYWIYESYTCDSGEVNCETRSVDTNFVTKDTIIDGETYFKIEGDQVFWSNPVFYRDSGDYIVNESGEVIFTHLNITESFNHDLVLDGNQDTIYYWYFKLRKDTEEVFVKAGEFSCLNFQGSFFRKNDDFETEYNMRNNYSKNVGLVEQSSFFASSLHVVKRELVGYHIEPTAITP